MGSVGCSYGDRDEVGLLEERLRLNLAVFHSEVTDQQVTAFTTRTGTLIVDAGESTQQGAEIELTLVPVAGLTIGASYGYLDVSYDRNIRALAPESRGRQILGRRGTL